MWRHGNKNRPNLSNICLCTSLNSFNIFGKSLQSSGLGLRLIAEAPMDESMPLEVTTNPSKNQMECKWLLTNSTSKVGWRGCFCLFKLVWAHIKGGETYFYPLNSLRQPQRTVLGYGKPVGKVSVLLCQTAYAALSLMLFASGDYKASSNATRSHPEQETRTQLDAIRCLYDFLASGSDLSCTFTPKK